jgi:phosphatidylinositol alpha-1,6-mannosyltransferase
MQALPKVFLGAATFLGGSGGIARVARLMSRVLMEEAATGRLTVRSASYLDCDLPSINLPVKVTRGSKLRFAWEAYKASLICNYFLYDFLGIMRAHPRLPLMRRPCLTWIHGIEVWETTNPAYLRCARRADFLVSNSVYTRERADQLHGGFHRAHICWLGTETDDVPPLPSLSDRPPTVLILGRMYQMRYKGHDELIDCWPRVVAAVPDARLVIVGKGPIEQALQRKAAASPAARSIVFKGFVPDEAMSKVWDETAILAMPSRGEGFGLVYIEAMRRGLPVIASIHDAAPEVNLEGVTGYNVDLNKPDQLPERIIYLLKNPDQAAALGRNGHQRWREQFTYTAFKQRFLSLLNDFLGGKR